MANNYLITGYWGEPHVTAENDRGIHAAAFGTGRFVLPVGRQFEAEYIGNNTIRMYDGKLMDNGAAAGIPAGEHIDFLIANASQGMKRNDLIVFQYVQDTSTLVERGVFVVIQGVETSGTPSDPVLSQDDLLSGNATHDQMAMWRISVSGTDIAEPVRVTPVVWNNPPMEPGVEYATNEFFNNKRVYTRLIATTWTTGSVYTISNFTKSAPHKYSGKVGTWSLPFLYTGKLDGGYSALVTVHKNGSDLKVNMYGGTSISGTMYLQIWYTDTEG